jgi:flagellar hook-basal body complex protein FliE
MGGINANIRARLEDLSAYTGTALAGLGEKTGAAKAMPDDGFSGAMLRALDEVSGYQQTSNALIQASITDPDSVDIHDITIAEAKANLSLNIARTLLDRITRGWKEIINTR